MTVHNSDDVREEYETDEYTMMSEEGSRFVEEWGW